MKNKFIQNFILLTCSTILMNIVEMLANAYITQKIGTTVLGTYSLIMNMFNFLITICMFGIPLAITKIISESYILNDNEKAKKTTKYSLIICTIISIIICTITIIFRNELNIVFLRGIVDEKVIIFLALSLPFMCLSSCLCGYFNALRKVNKTVLSEFFTHIIKNAIIIVLISKKVQTYFAFAIALFVSELSSFIISWGLYLKEKGNKNIKSKTSNAENLNILKNIFRISLPISFTSIVRSALSTLKHTLIPIRMQYYGYSYEYALSRYGMVHGIALPFILMPSFAIINFASLLLPEYSRYFASKNIAKIQELTNRIFKLVIFVSLYISFILYMSSDYLCLKLYNDVNISYYVKILTPLIVVMYLDFVVDSILRGLDLQNHVMKVNLMDVVTCIIIIYFGIPYLGTFGYILVIYISEYLNGILSINILLKVSKLDLNYTDILIKPLIFFFILFMLVTLPFNNKSSLFYVLGTCIPFSIASFLYFIRYTRKKTVPCK